MPMAPLSMLESGLCVDVHLFDKFDPFHPRSYMKELRSLAT